MANKLRSVFISLHKYCALGVGVIIVLMALSGTIILFDHKIEEMIWPEMFIIHDNDQAKSVDAWTAAAISTIPEGAILKRLDIPRHSGTAAIFHFEVTNPSKNAVSGRVMINPVKAEATGILMQGNSIIPTLYEFHHTFLLGKIGKYVSGLIGVVTILIVLSGLYLWWPKRISQIKAAFTIRFGKNAKATLYQFHRTSGAVISIAAGVLTISGIYMQFAGPLNRLISVVSPVERQPTVRSITENNSHGPPPLSQLFEKTRDRFPGASIKRVYFPLRAEDVFRVFVHLQGEPNKTAGGTRLYFDQYSGALLDVYIPREKNNGTRLTHWFFPLHSGEAFGWVGKSLNLMAGLGLICLFFSGLIFWWMRSFAK